MLLFSNLFIEGHVAKPCKSFLPFILWPQNALKFSGTFSAWCYLRFKRPSYNCVIELISFVVESLQILIEQTVAFSLTIKPFWEDKILYNDYWTNAYTMTYILCSLSACFRLSLVLFWIPLTILLCNFATGHLHWTE